MNKNDITRCLGELHRWRAHSWIRYSRYLINKHWSQMYGGVRLWYGIVWYGKCSPLRQVLATIEG